MAKFKEIVFTIHLMVKFPTPEGIATIVGEISKWPGSVIELLWGKRSERRTKK